MPALWISTEDKKLTHTIETATTNYHHLIFMDSVLTHKEFIEVTIRNEFIDRFPCKNLTGFIKGRRTDSLIVYSAHYDHLGMMGHEAMFPGASDNASGVSMIMYLADYYSRHQPEFTTAFILFSGEEAGLLGSRYFSEHPVFNLERIKMLINIDIMGNAEKGIVVVNGETCRPQFDLLQQINREQGLLPEVRIRGKARNSDHYHFAEKGVPAVFIYSDGGVGYYHDVFDAPSTIALTNYEKVAQLLIAFQKELSHPH
jgi:aminopeptidase YwaD